MRETPEQTYFRNSMEMGISLQSEIEYWLGMVVAGKRRVTQDISIADIVAGTTFDCMTVLKLFAEQAEREANEENDKQDSSQSAQDDVQQGSVDLPEQSR